MTLAIIFLGTTALASLLLVWKLTSLLPELAKHSMVLQRASTAEEAVAAHLTLEADAEEETELPVKPTLKLEDGTELELIHGELSTHNDGTTQPNDGEARRGFIL
jgi:hypothetical protein